MKRGWALLPLALVMLAPARAGAADRQAGADPWFGPDKALHFTASAVISSGGYGVSTYYTGNLATRIALGAGLGITVGAAKELLDLAGFGDPSWKDFAWDVIGTAIGVGISVSLDLATRRYGHANAY